MTETLQSCSLTTLLDHPGWSVTFKQDFVYQGFEWIDCHDVEQSVISYRRKGDHQELIVVLNFTLVVRENYRIGVPEAGTYHEIFNSDSRLYDGSHVANDQVVSEPIPWMHQTHSINLTLPPLAGIILKLDLA